MFQTQTSSEIRNVVTAGWHGIHRPFGHPVMLHWKYCRGVEYRKISFICTSQLSYTEMQSILDTVIEGDIPRLLVARIDFAVDIVGVPVSWFRESVVAPRKRFSQMYGRYTTAGQVEQYTVYLGKRPNCFCIYNKSAEQAVRGRRVPSDAAVTRIERRCGGAGIPKQIRTFADIPHALNFSPFEELKVSGISRSPSI